MKFIVALLLVSPLCFAEFKRSQIRYLSGPDLLSTLSALYPGAKLMARHDLSERCHTVQGSNRDVLGFESPALGKAIVDRPSPALIRWLNACVAAYVKLDFTDSGKFRNDLINDYFSPEMIKAFNLNDKDAVKQFFAMAWSKIPPRYQGYVIRRSIERLVGPGKILKAQGVMGGIDEFQQRIVEVLQNQAQSSWTVVNAIEDLQLAIIMSDEFLRY